MEAQRISKFIVENYNEHQQLIISELIKENIIIYREQQILNQKESIVTQNKYLNQLENNLILLLV